MLVPLLDLTEQYQAIRAEIDAEVARVVSSQKFILGEDVLAFEEDFARYCGAEHAIGVSSGTDALIVSLMALDIGPGDEVITSPYSFFASASSIARVGAKPVFADIEPIGFNIDPSLLDKVATPKTKALIPVHLFGQCVDMDGVLSFAQERNIPVIEDAAQAVGATFKGAFSGSMATAGCFSFFPSKNLGGFGDGGMVTTNDAELTAKLRNLRVHGQSLTSEPTATYEHTALGGNFRLDALQAAVLRVKLRHLDAWSDQRSGNAITYHKLFSESSLRLTSSLEEFRGGDADILLPSELPERRHVYNQFVIRAQKRDELKSFLGQNQVGCSVYYPIALPLQPCFSDLGYSAEQFPEAVAASQETLALPIFPELSLTQLEKVVDTVEKFYQK